MPGIPGMMELYPKNNMKGHTLKKYVLWSLYPTA